jgi:hypothetical protein
MPSQLAADPFSFLAVVIGMVISIVMAQRLRFFASRQRLAHVVTAVFVGMFAVPPVVMIYNFARGWKPSHFMEIAVFILYTGVAIGVSPRCINNRDIDFLSFSSSLQSTFCFSATS